jgi:hypothetical protein
VCVLWALFPEGEGERARRGRDGDEDEEWIELNAPQITSNYLLWGTGSRGGSSRSTGRLQAGEGGPEGLGPSLPTRPSQVFLLRRPTT